VKQLSLSSMIRRNSGSFGARPCRNVRRRILAGQVHTLPRSWQRSWIIARIVATPPWADFTEIRKVYDRAEQLRWETGQQWEVDHIVPLQHPLVCGLHVHWNLEPKLALLNNQKSNRFGFEQLELFE
jgi:hypothetical protein